MNEIQAKIAKQNKALALFVRLAFKRLRPSQQPKNIVLFRPSRIGDFIVAIPAMVALRKQFPAAKITFLSSLPIQTSSEDVQKSLQGSAVPPWFEFVVPGLVDEALDLGGSTVKEQINQAKQLLRRISPDLVILLPTTLETFQQRLKKLIFFRLAGLKAPIIGWSIRQSREFDVAAQFKAGMLEHHVVTAARAVFECPGMPEYSEDKLEFRLHLNKEAITKAETIWKEHDLDGRKVVALFPGATFEHKRWPIEKYVALVNHFQRHQNDLTFILLGAASDRITTTSLLDQLDHKFPDLTGNLSLMELAAVLSKVHAYVGSDTGPMHIATALSIPTIAIMNHQEFANSWEPWNSREFGLKHDVPCKGCYSFKLCPLGTKECITELPEARVIQSLQKILNLT